MYVMPLDRKNMFKHSDVHCRNNATETPCLICYECKLNNNKDLTMEHFSLEDRIAHMEAHEAAGHKISMWQLTKWVLEKDIKDNAVQSVTVHYAISNNGDGSASVHFFKTLEEAEKYEENMDEGWGESCVSSEELHFDKNGILINATTIEE